MHVIHREESPTDGNINVHSQSFVLLDPDPSMRPDWLPDTDEIYPFTPDV